MKIGDKVRITNLDYDDLSTGLEIGDFGEISAVCGYPRGVGMDVFQVKFNKPIPTGTINLNDDGTYNMFRFQLKVIKEEE